MNYTLPKAMENDFSCIYNLKKKSIQPHVEKIWGWNETYQLKDFMNDFKNIEDFSLILSNNNEIGFLQLKITQSHICIIEIHLIESFQGQGIGSSIIKGVIEQARNSKKNVSLGCFKDNIRAKNLYLRMGFSITGETESHYEFKLNI